jgi:hypothetical protein
VTTPSQANVVNGQDHPVEVELEAHLATVVAQVVTLRGEPESERQRFRGFAQQGRIWAVWRDSIGQATRLEVMREPTGEHWTVQASTQQPAPVRAVRITLGAGSYDALDCAATLVGLLPPDVPDAGEPVDG